jgi:ssDNA-binding Zn-finger/Zn-ribbon topoisomerase 1
MSEHIVKACPHCGQPLEIKRNRENGQEFLGCSGWRLTGCSYTERLPEAILLRRQGQRGLFDEEPTDA